MLPEKPDEHRCRAKADEVARLASQSREPSVRAAYEALARSWAKMADSLQSPAAPAPGRWH